MSGQSIISTILTNLGPFGANSVITFGVSFSSDSMLQFSKICIVFLEIRLHHYHYVLPGGRRGFFGGIQKFSGRNWGIGNFQLIYRGMSNFPMILINSVGLHYKLIICLKFLIQRTQIDDETTVHYANNFKSTIV